jgi:hypothetical protein
MPSPSPYVLAAKLVFPTYSYVAAASKPLQHLPWRKYDSIGSFGRPRHRMVVW